MNGPIKPIYLFADSQLLFWKPGGTLFLASVREAMGRDRPKAAYIGASNGDNPEFYALFQAAMNGIDIPDCRMIPSALSPDDAAFLDEADLILLAGGDVETGWNVFKQNGLSQTIVRRYYEGALLIGISAGAVQLGLLGWSAADPPGQRLIDTFRLIPLIIGVHEEKENWQGLRKAVQKMGGYAQGVGIPTGGGAIYHADLSLEPICHLLYEFFLKDDQVMHSLMFPNGQKAD